MLMEVDCCAAVWPADGAGETTWLPASVLFRGEEDVLKNLYIGGEPASSSGLFLDPGLGLAGFCGLLGSLGLNGPPVACLELPAPLLCGLWSKGLVAEEFPPETGRVAALEFKLLLGNPCVLTLSLNGVLIFGSVSEVLTSPFLGEVTSPKMS